MILHYEFDDVSIDYEVDRDEVIPKLKKWIIENLTKENYTTACGLCKEFFLGEKK